MDPKHLTTAPIDDRPVTEDVVPQRLMSFNDFHLSRELYMGIRRRGYRQPSPIQEEAIPAILAGRDVLARAKNGVGKTAAFAIPLLQRIDTAQRHVQAVVVVPSRELAIQHAEEMKKLGKYMKDLIPPMPIIGGVSITEDRYRLKKGVQIVVCTPGRALDLIDRGFLDVSRATMFVLDEADKLLTGDFVERMEQIRASLPTAHQTLLFSATFQAGIAEFRDRWMRAPSVINLQREELVLKGLRQYHCYLEENNKVRVLQNLFSTLEIRQSVIFVRSRERAEKLTELIQREDFRCVAIHGEMTQQNRLKAFHEFRVGRVRHLVSTDLITRGIDSQAVNVVINFDFPPLAKDYLHRIGRAGRFGHRGLAISFVTRGEEKLLFDIERDLDVTIEPLPTDGIPIELYDASTVVLEADGE
eukprot:gnl/Chilomastix_cuspidata/970.p1 GENE.gnl/Chilomastix_cuspidata/970~~gnl/Chilomastix_cuspidata/970.p1  ORF type:complete len:415 (-),score=218.40 gnl/Chilomastix_cuspidata/970:184-1428(-)